MNMYNMTQKLAYLVYRLDTILENTDSKSVLSVKL
jgi:hypothetical protein